MKKIIFFVIILLTVYQTFAEQTATTSPKVQPSRFGNNAECVSIDAPLSVSPGQKFTASIVMKNIGSDVWPAEYVVQVNPADKPVHLASQNPPDNNIWGITRVHLSNGITPYRQETFLIRATAPITPGVYDFDWQMVKERIQANEWFGQICSKKINVESAPIQQTQTITPTPTAQTQIPVQQEQSTITYTFSGPILIYLTKENSANDFSDLQNILKSTPSSPPVNVCDASKTNCLSAQELNKYSQLWVIGNEPEETSLEENQLNNIVNFWKEGKGLFLIAGDNYVQKTFKTKSTQTCSLKDGLVLVKVFTEKYNTNIFEEKYLGTNYKLLPTQSQYGRDCLDVINNPVHKNENYFYNYSDALNQIIDKLSATENDKINILGSVGYTTQYRTSSPGGKYYDYFECGDVSTSSKGTQKRYAVTLKGIYGKEYECNHDFSPEIESITKLNPTNPIFENVNNLFIPSLEANLSINNNNNILFLAKTKKGHVFSAVIPQREYTDSNNQKFILGNIAIDTSWKRFANGKINKFNRDAVTGTIEISKQEGDAYIYARNTAKWLEPNKKGNKYFCQKEGIWTGTECCELSENQEKNLYYNDFFDQNNPSIQTPDAGNIGGCWNNVFVKSGDNPKINGVDLKSVINVNGTFFSCGKTKDDLKITFDISQKSLCDSLNNINPAKQNAYCGYDNEFHLATGSVETKSISWDLAQIKEVQGHEKDIQSSCCGKNECFNGRNCVQAKTQLSNPATGEVFYCKNDGSWSKSYPKSTPNDAFLESNPSFYCTEASQCILKENTCVNSGYYEGDSYCADGRWTSRTKFLADKLLQSAKEISPNNFILSCGDYDESLNDHSKASQYLGNKCSYTTKSEGKTKNTKSVECTNSFCTIKAGDKILFGATLNSDIKDASTSILKAFNLNEDSCDNTQNQNSFSKCSAENIFFSPALNATIFSKEELSSYDQNSLTNFNQYILQNANAITPKLEEFAQNIKLFNTLFYQKKQEKEIFAVLEKKTKYKKEENKINAIGDYYIIAVSYSKTNPPLASNHCLDIKSMVKFGDDTQIDCIQGQSSEIMIITGKDMDEIKIKQLWKDLTTKLRLQ